MNPPGSAGRGPPGRAGRGPSPAPRRGAAFTLIELLLVVAISLIVAGIAVPSLMRSLRGERLRAAARALATSHRLARATSALRAEEVVLRIEPGLRRVLVLRPGAAAPAPPAAPDGAGADAPPAPDPGDGGTPPGPAVDAFRGWADDVRVLRIEVGGDVFEDGEPRPIRYAPGGTSPAYAVFLEDARGDRAAVHVDPVTGKARVTYERGAR